MNSMLNVAANPRQCHTTKTGLVTRTSVSSLAMVLVASVSVILLKIPWVWLLTCGRGAWVHWAFAICAKHQRFCDASVLPINDGSEREGDSREGRSPDYYGDHLWRIIYASNPCRKKRAMQTSWIKRSRSIKKTKRATQLKLERFGITCARAIEFTYTNTGEPGLPLLGFADWNDTVNLPTGAESMMVANMYGKHWPTCWLCELRGEAQLTAAKLLISTNRCRVQSMNAAGMAEMVCSLLWWARICQSVLIKTSKGRSTLTVKAGLLSLVFATQERATQALDSVYNKLNTANGIKLSTPGYNGFDPQLGGVSTYPPGAKENGGIFLHSNPWVMIAERSENGQRWACLWVHYRQINPASKNDDIDTFESEPYCYPQNILGDSEHKQFGLGRNAWLSRYFILDIRCGYAMDSGCSPWSGWLAGGPL